MATKAELEAARDRYGRCAATADFAAKNRDPAKALGASLASLEFVPPFVGWARKYGGGAGAGVELPTIDLILGLAPALFEWRAVERLAAFAAAEAKLFKRLGRDLAGEVRAAGEQFRVTSALWDRLAALGAGAPLPEWSARDALPAEKVAVRVWSELGVAAGSRAGVRLQGALDDPAVGMCGVCGALRRGESREFLIDQTCAACGKRAAFVIIPEGRP